LYIMEPGVPNARSKQNAAPVKFEQSALIPGCHIET
jgi:hypothetical protein